MRLGIQLNHSLTLKQLYISLQYSRICCCLSITYPVADNLNASWPKKRGNEQAAMGFEPMNNGFANRRLRPLGYAAKTSISYASAAKAETQKIIYSTSALIASKLRAKSITADSRIPGPLYRSLNSGIIVAIV